MIAAAGGGAPWRDEEETAAAQEAEQIMIASCLIRLIHLLSLYREVYLTPKPLITIIG